MSTESDGEAQGDDDETQYATDDDIAYLTQQLIKLENEMGELRETVEIKEDRIADLEAEVERLDSRTDMLRLVEDADQLDAKQRSATLLMHLRRKAENSDGTSAVNHDQAEEAMHFPEVHRTTIYSDMERCEDLVGDEDVCSYTPKSEGTTDEALLRLNLNNGSIPGAALSTGSTRGE